MTDVVRTLAADGLEPIGTITLGGVLVVGDPLVIGRTPANGAYHAASCEPGTWYLFVRAHESDPDAISELIAIHADGLPRFYELYDEAGVAGELPADSGRLTLLDGKKKDDVDLRTAMFEPDLDALPWVLDEGVVVGVMPGGLPRVFEGAESPLRYLSVGFGVRPLVPMGRPLTDAVG